MAEFDQLIARMFNDADRLARILAANGPPREPNDADRLAVARDNERGRPGCSSCAQIESKANPAEPYYVEADERYLATQVLARGEGREFGIAGGVPRLKDEKDLCSWCYGFVRDRWRLPAPKEIRARRDDGRVRMPADEEQQVRTRKLARCAEYAAELAEARAGTGADPAGGPDTAVAS